MSQLNFDANQHDPQTTLEPLPVNWYLVQIVESEMKPTRDGNGAYLELHAKVMEGEHKGRVVFIRLNLENQNPTTVEIAYKQLSAICHCIGQYQIRDSQELHGKPFQVRVTVRPPRDGFDATNEVKGFRDANGNEPGKTPTAGAAPSAPAAPAAPNAAPAAQPPPPQQEQSPAEPAQGQPADPAAAPPAAGTDQQANAAPATPASGDVPAWARPGQ